MRFDRRSLLFGALGGFTAAAAGKTYRAGVIGHTGHGNYGHGLDVVWKSFERIDVVAVADADEAGLAAAVERTGAKRAYRDYREMLRKEKPDLVSIGPRWMDQRVEMVTAAAEAGCHIYMEKPFARDLMEADKMVEAVARAKVKVQLAHQMRCSPFVLRARELVSSGAIGTIQEIRGRGKEDQRAGGEDMMVLGSHICDIMRIFAGDPQWVVAHATDDGRELNGSHVRPPTEPIGPVAGREIAAMVAFANGIHGYFSSKACEETHPLRFGTQILGSKGAIFLPNAAYPDGQPYILRTPAWFPDEKHQWEKILLTGAPPPFRGEGPAIANALMVQDLLEAIEEGRKPACSELDGRWTIEMIMGVYEAQRTRGRVTFPLSNREHPLTAL
jgi:predicted dehydrogenase